MNKKSIIVTIENYQGKKLTYSIPEEDTINIWTVNTLNGQQSFLSNVNIELFGTNGIEVKEENR